MAINNSLRVFLSATTRDLGSYREAIADCLRTAGCHVEVQENFAAHPGKFLAKLRDYLAPSDVVVCLVGDHFGWQPPDAALIPSPARDAYPEPLVSATEWEYFLAVDAGSDIFLFLTEPSFTPDRPSDDSAESGSAHRLFREHVLGSGRDCNRFRDLGPLKEAVLAAFHVRTLRRAGGQRPRLLPKRAHHFTGRVADIDWVRAKLRSEHRVALIGPGGIGKTAIAHESIATLSPDDAPFSHFPGGIFLHDFYAAPSHLSAIEDIMAQAGLFDIDEREREPRARALLAGTRCLVYLEGCEKAEDLPRLIDLCGPATVFITSRQHNDGKGASVRHIVPLFEDEAAEMLRRHAMAAVHGGGAVPGKADGVWREIAVLLGRHALALRLAGHWLGGGNETPAEFRDMLKTEGFEHFDDDQRTKESLDLLFSHSAEALTPSARAAWYALARHALVPIHLSPIAAALKLHENKTRKALNELFRRSLADAVRIPSVLDGKDESAWLLSHPLLAEWGKKRLEVFAVPVKMISGNWMMWWGGFIDSCFASGRVPGGERRYLAIREHLDAFLEGIAVEWGAESHGITVALNTIGSIHRSMGRYSAAEKCYRRDLAISETILGLDHPETLISLNSLAIVLQRKGDWDTAESTFRRVLAAREQALAPAHPATLESVDNLATLLHERGDLAGARLLNQRALEGRDRIFGPEHPITLQSLNNFANLLYEEGNLAEAQSLHQRALEARERTLGPEHPETLQTLHNLALIYQAKGEYPTAEHLNRRALEARERTLGAEHPDSLKSLSNVAALLYMKGDLAEAEALLRRALEVHERNLGEEHLNTLIVAVNLASLLTSRGELSAAEPLARRVVKGFATLLLPQNGQRKHAEELLAQIQAGNDKARRGED